jgi:translation initiation factor 1
MAKKQRISTGIVYSTNPNFSFEEASEERQMQLPPAEQPIRIRLETKHRAGKAVTLVEGYSGSADDKASLGKQLKNYCGTGGSAKDGEILVQGDQRDKVLAWMRKNGYNKARIV